MNCTQYKEKLTNSLAAGETVLSVELSSHQQSCEGCRAFHDSQVELFRSMDASLLAIANEPVPPSFLPGVRARLDEQPTPHRPWFGGWRFAFIATGAVAAVSVGLLWHRPFAHPSIPETKQLALRAVDNQIPAVPPAPNSPAIFASRAPKRVIPAASPSTISEVEPEVIVLPEEQEAFARFVARLPEEKNVALALTRPAPDKADVPVEIALLNLGSVEVKPLVPEARE